jgi:hypothetical protein
MTEGMTNAEVFIKDTMQQSTLSFVWDRGHCFYVGGKANTASDYSSVGKFLVHKFLHERIQVAKVYYNSDEWELALKDSLNGISAKILERTLLKHDYGSKPLASVGPNIFDIREIDINIIENTQIKNIQQMTEEILGMWGTTSRFLENGFGYCAYWQP